MSIINHWVVRFQLGLANADVHTNEWPVKIDRSPILLQRFIWSKLLILLAKCFVEHTTNKLIFAHTCNGTHMSIYIYIYRCQMCNKLIKRASKTNLTCNIKRSHVNTCASIHIHIWAGMRVHMCWSTTYCAWCWGAWWPGQEKTLYLIIKINCGMCGLLFRSFLFTLC